VLARDVVAEAADDLDPRWLADRLATTYPQCWTFLVDGLVGASPEMLVKREAGLIMSGCWPAPSGGPVTTTAT
jgi:menaquinone-specific isochorismate synthase